MILLKEQAAEFMLEASRGAYPNEFLGLLKANGKGEIFEVHLFPRTVFGKNFSSIDFLMVPLGSKYAGSVHSHPGPSNNPSKADLRFFQRMGEKNIIIKYPYRTEDMQGYDQKGEKQEIKII